MDYKKKLQIYLEREVEVIKNLNLEDINRVMNVLEEARLTNRKIYICGNGGSAATASHYTGDFNKGINENLKVKYDFECLNDNIPAMMAIANDISYNEIFRVLLKNKMKAGDIFIGLSGSGNSQNIVNAMEYAREIGGTTVAIVGYDGGKLKQIADYYIHVEINDMQISEDIHMILDHMMMQTLCNCSKDR